MSRLMFTVFLMGLLFGVPPQSFAENGPAKGEIALNEATTNQQAPSSFGSARREWVAQPASPNFISSHRARKPDLLDFLGSFGTALTGGLGVTAAFALLAVTAPALRKPAFA